MRVKKNIKISKATKSFSLYKDNKVKEIKKIKEKRDTIRTNEKDLKKNIKDNIGNKNNKTSFLKSDKKIPKTDISSKNSLANIKVKNLKNKEYESEKKNKNTFKNKKEKEKFKSNNISLSKKKMNKDKINIKSRKNNGLSPKPNKTIKTYIPKIDSLEQNTKNLIVPLDPFFTTASKSKETVSTNLDTISNEENIKKELKLKKGLPSSKNQLYQQYKKSDKNIIKLEMKAKQREEIRKKLELCENESKTKEEKIKKRVKFLVTILTPMPAIKKKASNGDEIDPNSKVVQNAKYLRRQEYNDYTVELNKPRPKKPKPKPKPEPKVYDNNKVNMIQRMYKGFQIRTVNQIINRLKIQSCVTELFCLITNEVCIHARKRIFFYTLKLYYYDPFANIEQEVDFSDKILMKLSDRYYNFNNFIQKQKKKQKK